MNFQNSESTSTAQKLNFQGGCHSVRPSKLFNRKQNFRTTGLCERETVFQDLQCSVGFGFEVTHFTVSVGEELSFFNSLL